MKKYVVSGDVFLLMSNWSQFSKFSLPNHSFFQMLKINLLNELEEIFGKDNVDCLAEEMLVRGISGLLSKESLPIISVDRTYVNYPRRLEISRAVDKKLSDYKEIPRFNCEPIEKQINELKKEGLGQVILLDDVIFSGNGAVSLIDELRKIGIEIKKVISGVLIGEGCENLKSKSVEALGVFYYDDVIDEICERDFYAGVPYSGRSISESEINLGAPYFYPFGLPGKWASIPEEREKIFSKFCLNQSILLWEEVEKASKRRIRVYDLPRIPIGAEKGNPYFVDYLQSLL